MNNKTILITGGAGFIGSNLALYIQDNYPDAQIIILDRFQDHQSLSNGNSISLGHFSNLIGFKGEIITADINNKNDLRRIAKLNFDILYHMAAISDTTASNQTLVMQTNHQAFLELLKIASHKKAKIIYASSAGVYGNSPAPNCIGKNENPKNIYGFSKLRMDESVRKILAQNPYAHIVGLRFFNVYGEGEFFKGKTASMILQLSLQIQKNQKVKLFEDGEQKRDFVYIKDVVQACILASKTENPGIYNIGVGQSRSFNEVINILKIHLGNFEVEYIKNPYTFFQTHTCADLNLSYQNLNYHPKFTLEKGIQEYIPKILNYLKEESPYEA